MSVRSAAPLVDSVNAGPAPVAVFFSRVVTLWLVELRKLAHDRMELYTRAIQPALWLVVFGETMSSIRVIPTPNGVRYLDYLTPGIMGQSALFIAIFYGLLTIWERDAGILTKLLVTPTPRTALVAAKAFAASVRAGTQVLVVFFLGAILGVRLNWNPLHLATALALVALGVAFFTTLSILIASIVLKQERLMGVGQAITVPLFFSSNALYPINLMPGWLQSLSHANPLTLMIDGLRGTLLGIPSHLALDFAVLSGLVLITVVVAGMLLPRLGR